MLRPVWKLQARRGDPLARLVRIDIDPAAEPTFNDTIGLHGLKRLPVSLGAAVAS
ncbi:hypothetical protein [Mycobacterium kyorinense]|uniref:hypothetical protein n=1 Tax=Mycobacterium kyorinense TaxID=487514 RepID=UPI000A91B1B7|nr:hypothetical protein [Mycobacterium kyorinense]